MFWEFFRFELRGHLRRPSLYVCFAVAFGTGLWALLSQSGYFPGGGISLAGAGRGDVHADAPLALFLIITFFNIAGLLVTGGGDGAAPAIETTSATSVRLSSPARSARRPCCLAASPPPW